MYINIYYRDEVRKITYSWFSRYTSRDNDDISTSEGFFEAIIRRKVTFNFSRGSDM